MSSIGFEDGAQYINGEKIKWKKYIEKTDMSFENRAICSCIVSRHNITEIVLKVTLNT